MMRKFRFGVVHRSAPLRADWRDLARRAEDLGYSTFLLSEHFGPHFAMGPALISAADATQTLRVGSMVYDADFRHPAVLAKEAATIDLLTDGRFELGLGAGWMASDYEQTGMAFDSPGVRADRFGETLQVLKGLFAERPLTFRGKHFAIQGLDGLPKPLQKPHLPILVGAGGPRMIRLAAREANIISVLMQSLPGGGLDWPNASSKAFDQKLQWVREAAGEGYSDLEISILMQKTVVTNDPHSAAEQVGRLWEIPTEAAVDCPLALIGSVEQMADDLEARRQRFDASYICVFGEVMEAFAPVVARLSGR